MSSYYVANGPVPFDEIKCYNRNGITVNEINEIGSVILTDGVNYVWALPADEGWPFTLERFGGNDPDRIIAELESHYGVKFFAEWDDEFYDLVHDDDAEQEPPVRHERFRRPRKCPECGSSQIAEILYGMPDFGAIKDDLDAGRITLGGCCVTDDDPTWQCLQCEAVVFRKSRE